MKAFKKKKLSKLGDATNVFPISRSDVPLEAFQGKNFRLYSFVSSASKSAIRDGVLALRFLRNPRGGIHCFVKILRRDGRESAGVAPDSASGCRQCGSGRSGVSPVHLSRAPRQEEISREVSLPSSLLLVQLKARAPPPTATQTRQNARDNVNNYCYDH